eukprot:TRINITY_DN18462_c0_g1_i2.p1 TRINITY_DN18462_c0_g1~~TRINITY_DN18462_c0_g1_i2.p1  ORF type:complete len:330 (-),score=42.34 TRINITY_DN18462_c0_g1_i2:105-1031(-)
MAGAMLPTGISRCLSRKSVARHFQISSLAAARHLVQHGRQQQLGTTSPGPRAVCSLAHRGAAIVHGRPRCTGEVANLPAAMVGSALLQRHRAFCTGEPGPKDEKKAENQQEKPKEEPTTRSELCGISFFELVTFPTRHFVWNVALATVGWRYPHLWSRTEFREGVEYAVRAVHECLVEEDFGTLMRLVHGDLLERLKHDDTRRADQHWAAEPVLEEADYLGILWATTYGEGTEANAFSGAAIEVEVAVVTIEKYEYTDSAPLTLRRLQRWKFQRPVVDVDSAWKIVGISAKPWYGLRSPSGSGASSGT